MPETGLQRRGQGLAIQNCPGERALLGVGDPFTEAIEQLGLRVWSRFIRERLIECTGSAAQDPFVNPFSKLRGEKRHKSSAPVVHIPELDAVAATGEPPFVLTGPFHQRIRGLPAIRLRRVINRVVFLESLNKPLWR